MAAKLKSSQTFRVFISSPFRGMEEEREELTRKYFPQIRHKCAEMGLQFVAVDMRWGITTEASDNAQTINICLREIDRSDMFVCFFGQRYGWHLDQSGGHANGLLLQSIDSALSKYPWLDKFRDRSVTEIELLHGHLNNPGAMPACILFRDKKYDDIMCEMKKEMAVNYMVESEIAMEKMADLKKRVVEVKEKAVGVYMDYPNPIEAARMMFEDIMKHLETKVLLQDMELSKRDKDLIPHKAFMASRTALYIGRTEDFDRLDANLLRLEKEAVEKGLQEDTPETGEKEKQSVKRKEAPAHMLVLGPAGCGKSALMCNWLQDRVAKRPDVLVIAYFVGCAPNTRDPEELLGFVYSELEHHLSEKNTGEAAANSTPHLSICQGVGNQAHIPTHASNSDKAEGSREQQSDGGGEKTLDMKTGDSGKGKNEGSGDETSDVKNNVSRGDTIQYNTIQIQYKSPYYSQTWEIGLATSDDTKVSTFSNDELVTVPGDGKVEGSVSSGTNKDGSNGYGSNKVPTVSMRASGDGKMEGSGGKSSDSKKGASGDDGTSKVSGATSASKDESGSKPKEPQRPKGKELQRAIIKQLQKVVEKGHIVLLVFDAVSRLVSQRKTGKQLYWLPEKLPWGVMCVVLTDETDQATLDILQKERQYDVLKLLPLEEGAQRQICLQSLEQSGKALSENQLKSIVDAEQTANPLFLKTVLAELSIFGKFRELDSKISSLISFSSVKALLHNCLERLETDYNLENYQGNLVGDILSALEISPEGLTETQVMDIFSVHSHQWSPLCFAIEFFTVSHLGKLGFAIADFREAVRERYLQNTQNERRIREKLITYFDGIRKGLRPWVPTKHLCVAENTHAMLALVLLQKAQGDRGGLITSLSDLSVFIILNSNHDLDLLELWKWTELRWSDITNLLLVGFDRSIADCYTLMMDGALDNDNSPGVRLRTAVANMRSFFELAMHFPGVEKALTREIRILENAGGKMSEDKRKEYLRDARYYLACNFFSQDRYHESREAHQANLITLEKDLEEKEDEEIHKQIAFTQNGLGLSYMNFREYDKAVEYFIKSAACHQKMKNKRCEAAAYTNLGLCYMYKQQFDRALKYNEKAIEAYEEDRFGQMSQKMGNVMTNMGLIYRRKRNFVKAEEFYLKSLQVKATAVGWDHPLIATAWMNLGTLEMHRSNFAKAEEYTRKAIAIYEVNEYEKSKKEFRQCRENLVANMAKQNKMEELLPLYVEIFDILKANGWMEECLATMHRNIVDYMIEKKMFDKAEEVCMALIDSPKQHPQSFAQLYTLDMRHPKDKRPARPAQYSLATALDKYLDNSYHPTLCQLKMELELLPDDDRDGIRTMMCHIANPLCFEVVNTMQKLIKVADEQKKTDVFHDVLKGLVEENVNNEIWTVNLLRMYLRVCVHTKRAEDAAPYLSTVCTDPLQSLDKGLSLLAPQQISPSRTRLDIAYVLLAKGEKEEARTFLQECCKHEEIHKEARAVLDQLNKEEKADAENTDQESDIESEKADHEHTLFTEKNIQQNKVVTENKKETCEEKKDVESNGKEKDVESNGKEKKERQRVRRV